MRSVCVIALVLSACADEGLIGAYPSVQVTVAGSDDASAIGFGGVLVTDIGKRQVTVTNRGKTRLLLSEFKLEGAVDVYGATALPEKLEVGQDTSFFVSFEPRAVNDYVGKLSFVTNDPKAKRVSIDLNGAGKEPSLMVCAPPIDLSSDNCRQATRIVSFGETIAGQSKRRAIRLSAPTADVRIYSVNIVGKDAAAFTLSAAPTDELLRGDRVIEVTYHASAPGPAEAEIVVESNDPFGPSARAKLSAVSVSDCEQQTETLTGAAGGKLDVLFVFDNSGTMAEEQAAVKSRIMLLIARLAQSGVDYHIGVTTTTMGVPSEHMADATIRYPQNGVPGSLVRAADGHAIVTAASHNGDPVGAFQEIMESVDVLGSSREHGLMATRAALTAAGQSFVPNVLFNAEVYVPWIDPDSAPLPPAPIQGARNAAFYRDDARLAVVIVSDADDAMSGDKRHDQTPVATYASFLTGLKPNPAEDLRVIGIIDPRATVTAASQAMPCFNALESNEGALGSTVMAGTPRYHAFFDALGPTVGRIISICDDFDQTLSLVGETIAPACDFTLTHVLTADEATSFAKNGGAVTNVGWTYAPPSAGAPNGSLQITNACPTEQVPLVISYTSCKRSYDRDFDGVADLQDNCAAATNTGQEDDNYDGVGNVCRPLP